MRIARSFRSFLAALTLFGATAAPAAADGFRAYFSLSSEKRLPDCNASSVQNAVAGRVARARKDYYGGRKIVSIDQINEVDFQVNGISPLARRYCQGKASLSDGSLQNVHYMLEEHAGFVGVSWNVEACLAPLDKWHVYGAHCSTARPR